MPRHQKVIKMEGIGFDSRRLHPSAVFKERTGPDTVRYPACTSRSPSRCPSFSLIVPDFGNVSCDLLEVLEGPQTSMDEPLFGDDRVTIGHPGPPRAI